MGDIERNRPRATRSAGIDPSTSSQRALQTVLDWSPRLSYTVNRREASPGNVICEGETHGFEET